MPVSLCFSCQRCLLSRASTQITAALQARCMASKDDDLDIQLPPEPTTCCMSGCANCVWVEYAQTVAKLLGDNKRAREIVLAKIKDPNLAMFLMMELNRPQAMESSAKEPKKKPE